MYASRTLTDVERCYSQTEKEALGLIWGCERFHVYLVGSKFELWTDLRPLEFIFYVKSKPSARIKSWVLRLQSFGYRVMYFIPDSLLRLVPKFVKRQNDNDDSEEFIRSVTMAATPIAVTTREIKRPTENDDELRNIRKCIISEHWERCQLWEYLSVRNELCAVDNIVLRGTRIVIPKKMRSRILELGHEGHPGIVVMKRDMRLKL